MSVDFRQIGRFIGMMLTALAMPRSIKVDRGLRTTLGVAHEMDDADTTMPVI